MSNLCPPMRARAGAAFISLNPADAERLGVGEGDGVQLSHAPGQPDIEVHIDERMPAGCAGYSAGFADCPTLEPGWLAPLGKSPNWKRRPQLIGSDQSRKGGGNV